MFLLLVEIANRVDISILAWNGALSMMKARQPQAVISRAGVLRLDKELAALGIKNKSVAYYAAKLRASRHRLSLSCQNC